MPQVECQKSFCRERQAPPGDFDPRSFRSRKTKAGTILIFGCPRGAWKARAKRCSEPLQLQTILRPKRHAKCRRACTRKPRLSRK